MAPFDWFMGRREWLRRFCALGFWEVDLVVEMVCVFSTQIVILTMLTDY